MNACVMTGAKRNDNLFWGGNALRCHFNVKRERCKSGNLEYPGNSCRCQALRRQENAERHALRSRGNILKKVWLSPPSPLKCCRCRRPTPSGETCICKEKLPLSPSSPTHSAPAASPSAELVPSTKPLLWFLHAACLYVTTASSVDGTVGAEMTRHYLFVNVDTNNQNKRSIRLIMLHVNMSIGRF